jgi:predicted dehydrogenase
VLDYPKAVAEIYIAAHQPTGSNHRTFEIQGTLGTATVTPFSNSRLTIETKDGAEQVAVPPEARPSYSPDLLELAAVARGERKPSYTPGHDLAAHHTLPVVADTISLKEWKKF